MKLDLKSTRTFTLENVQRLIASKASTQTSIVVSRDGTAFMSADLMACDTLAFYIQIQSPELGTRRDRQGEWARKVFVCLKNNWPIPRDVYL